MPTEAAVLLHPAARRPPAPGLARRAGTFGGELLLAAAIIAGGTVAVALVLLLLLLAAPLAAALVGWLVWRSGDGASRRAARVRSRLRRRARALGLVVLAGSQPGVLRLATAGARHPAKPPRGAAGSP
jgi:hypothetical protein